MRTHPRLTPMSVLALGVAAALAFASNAQAAGFQLKENSVRSMGSAFAGTAAKTGDSSVVVNNPAAMTLFEDDNVLQIDLTAIDLNYEFEGTATDAFGRPMSGGQGGNAGGVTPVPAFSYVRKVNDRFAVGAMLSVPFGLATEYEDGWVGRYFAHTSDVRIVDLALSGAFDVNDQLSLGFGAIVSRADVTLSRSIDFGALLFSNPATRPLPFAQPQAADGFVDISGADTGYGWLAGIHYRPSDAFSIGLSYRSEIDYDIRGSADWTVPGNVAAVFGASPTTAPLFQDGGASADLTTPSILSLGATWKVNDQVTVLASVAKTYWSTLDEVRVRFDNPDPDAVEPFEWHNSLFFSVGAEFEVNRDWTLRAGIAKDETPTSLAHRTPRLPDDDRVWFSVGATWRASDAMDLNFGLTHIKPDDPKVDIASSGSRIAGPFDGTANLVGVSMQYRF